MFIGCSLIPIILLAVLSYTQIIAHLTEQNKRRLHQQTKSYGMSVYERVLLLETTLQLVGSNFRMNLDSTAVHDFESPNNTIKKKFKALAVFSGITAPLRLTGRIDQPPQIIEAQKTHIYSGKSAIVIEKRLGSAPRIFMLRLVDPHNPALGILMGEIDSVYLWGMDPGDILPKNTKLLLLDDDRRLLLNAWPVSADYLENLNLQMNTSASFQFEWKYKNEAIITSLWPVFLKSNFFITDFIVVLSQSKEDLLAAINQFKKTFWSIVLLTFLIVIFLSIQYIRKNFEPLEKLKEATLRITNGDYSHLLRINSKDEFEALAESFNTMSRQLGIQFKNLKTITETGLLASMTVDIEQILKSLTDLIVRNLDFSRGMVMLSEKEPPVIKYVAGYGYAKNQLEKLEQCTFPLNSAASKEYFVHAFQKKTPFFINDVSELQTALSEGAVEYAKQMQVQAFVSAPIVYKSEALGLILLENPRSEREITPTDLNLLIGMAAHIAGSIFNALTIQELNQKESALLRSHLELEARVKERTTELSGLNRDLQKEIVQRQQVEKELRRAKEMSDKANQAKSDFLANMSHELRTPLNHIIGFTELVLDKNFGDLNDTQCEYLTDVHTSSKHLLSLINDILDLSKVEAGKQELQLADVNLKMLLENSLVMVKEKSLKHAIQTSVDTKGIPDTINADERMLKQIIYNLLSNAVKFSPDGGKVSLTARPCTLNERDHTTNNGHRKHGVKISVSDTGIGLKPQDLDFIFNPFDQVENSLSRRFQGTGLGLSLTKNLVELHNGRIWAQSEGEGKGSTFSFIIPV